MCLLRVLPNGVQIFRLRNTEVLLLRIAAFALFDSLSCTIQLVLPVKNYLVGVLRIFRLQFVRSGNEEILDFLLYVYVLAKKIVLRQLVWLLRVYNKNLHLIFFCTNRSV
jgi:hypothetical protein